MMSNPNSNKILVAGHIGGACLILVGHPFDVVRNQIQANSNKQSMENCAKTFECLKKVVEKEGFLALYKNIKVPIFIGSPAFGLFFTGCAIGQDFQRKCSDNKEANFMQNAKIGALGGALALLVTMPAENFIRLLQKQTGLPGLGNAKNQWEAMSQLEIKRFFKGTSTALLKEIPSAALYYSTYMHLKSIFIRKNSKKFHPIATFFAGGFSGLTYLSVSTFISILQEYFNTFSSQKSYQKEFFQKNLSKIISQGGPVGLVSGFTPYILRDFKSNFIGQVKLGHFGPIILRAFSSHAMCFIGFEFAVSVLC